MGLLVFKSGYFPKVLGVLLVINCASHLVDILAALLFPDVRATVSPVLLPLMAIGEVPFLLWLLIRGARNSDRGEGALDSA